MKMTSLLLCALLAACSGTSSNGSSAVRELASNERIADVPSPSAIHASGFSSVVVTVDPGAASGVGQIPAGSHVQLGGGTLHVDGHGSVELTVHRLADLKVTGHSTAFVRCLNGGSLDADVSGQSSAELSGTLDSLDARVTGGSDLTGRYLTVGQVTHTEEGHSTIDLNSTAGDRPSCAPANGGAGGSGQGGEGGSGGTGGTPIG